MVEIVIAGLGVLAAFLLPLIVLFYGHSLQNQKYRDTVLAGFDHEEPETFEAVPPVLLELHKNASALKREVDFEILPPTGDSLVVQHFMPLRQDSLGFVRATCQGSWFPVAANVNGQYCIELDPLIPDPPVHFFHYDYGDNRVVAPELSDFLNWPRKYRKRNR